MRKLRKSWQNAFRSTRNVIEIQWNASVRNTDNLSLAGLIAEPLDPGFPCSPSQADFFHTEFHISCAPPLKPLPRPLRAFCLPFPYPLMNGLASRVILIRCFHFLTLSFR